MKEIIVETKYVRILALIDLFLQLLRNFQRSQFLQIRALKKAAKLKIIIIDVIDLVEQVKGSISEGISTSRWVETDVREEPAWPEFEVNEHSIPWKFRHLHKGYYSIKPEKWQLKLYTLITFYDTSVIYTNHWEKLYTESSKKCCIKCGIP